MTYDHNFAPLISHTFNVNEHVPQLRDVLLLPSPSCGDHFFLYFFNHALTEYQQ